MYGTLLDQKVFESLVERTMPILWEHLVKADVQLSVVSLPWFLSLYINSMPLVFAFRVLDVFFLEGPKILFQVGLAILRINGEDLLDVTDDGAFISILKTYFSRLDESAHPTSENEKLRAVTKFQELMVVAIKEFSAITQATISEQRTKHKDAVLDNIETFAKRTSIRNLGPDSKRLNTDDLSLIYDRFYGILYEQERSMQLQRQETQKSLSNANARAAEIVTGVSGNVEMGRVGIGPSPELMNYDGFRDFLAGMAKWAIEDAPRTPFDSGTFEKDGLPHSSPTSRYRETPNLPFTNGRHEPADHDFMQRLYGRWNKGDKDGLSLQNVVSGLADVKGSRDLMGTIAYFFNLYDDDRDGRVGREGILKISEALLFLSRRGLEGNFTLIGASPGGRDESIQDNAQRTVDGSTLGEKFLNSVSAFIRRCFEYADPDHPQNQNKAAPDGLDSLNSKVDNFAIGDDDDDNLLDLSPEKTHDDSKEKNLETGNLSPNSKSPQALPSSPQTPSKQSANLALDPANPLHITLPTFRMVILADELLQQFFEFSFADSLHIAPEVLGRASSTFSIQTPTLTTFSSLNARQIFAPSASMGDAAPSQGLRGLLDNIVTDGMRVAAEVRKKMDEAQKELERSALAHDEEEEEEEDDAPIPGIFAADLEKRGVREGDMDLLDGAEVGSIRGGEGPVAATEDGISLEAENPAQEEQLVEFER